MWSSYKIYKLRLEIDSDTIDLKNYHIDNIISIAHIGSYKESILMTFNYNISSRKLHLLKNIVTPITIEIYYVSKYMLRQDKLERILNENNNR